MGLKRRRLWLATVILLITGLFFQTGWLPFAPAGLSGGFSGGSIKDFSGDSPRKTKLTVPYTRFGWWLTRWSDNQVACRFGIERDGLPTAEEIQLFCGETLLNEWKATTPCQLDQVGGNLGQCPGLYLHQMGVTSGKREITVDLPVSKVWVSISGCEEGGERGRCANLPRLLFTGDEPLPNETIIRISGNVDGQAFSCGGGTCEIPLQPTGLEGQPIEFWADSSFGDSSEHFTGIVRVVPWGDFTNPEAKGADTQMWYVDLLSSQYQGGSPGTCMDTWQSLPDLGGPPSWLSTPANVEELQSAFPFYLLAAVLIQSGDVDASSCPNGGLLSPRVANGCGIEVAQPRLVEWQNRFDSEILQVAKDTGVPAQLMKNVFRRESQFWPGIYRTYKEAGLGQLTDNGADTVLLWNPTFFGEFCPLVLHQSVCDKGFGNIAAEQQAILRGALVKKVNAACADCPAGVDLRQANFSVKIFAEGLTANCEQVGRILYNTTRQMPGQTTSYEDLWRLTLVNYNAGPGCLTRAVQTVYRQGQPLDFARIALNLEPVCKASIEYVNDISQAVRATATPTAWLPPEAAATVAPPRVRTAAVTGTVAPTGQPTATRAPTTAATRTPTPAATQGYAAPQPTTAPYSPPTYPTQNPVYP